MRSTCVDHGYAGIAHGYAQQKVAGKFVYKHRLAYCADRGVSMDSIKGIEIRHTCDNGRCVNPQHLETGSHSDNMQDMAQRGRAASTITAEDATFIKANYKFRDKLLGGAALASRFGISKQTVCDIIKGRHFKDYAE